MSFSQEKPITVSHRHSVSCVSSHPTLPIILTGSEDGIVKIWNADTYRLQFRLNYGLGRVWTIGCLAGTNEVIWAMTMELF